MSATKEHYHNDIEKGQREALSNDREHDEFVQRYASQQDPEEIGEESESDDEDIFGYECLGCGHIQDYPGECEMCTGSAVDPMYF